MNCIAKIEKIYDYRMHLLWTDEALTSKKYTYEKAVDYANKFYENNKNLSDNEMSENFLSCGFLVKFEPEFKIRPKDYINIMLYVKEQYSDNVYKFMECALNYIGDDFKKGKYEEAYDHLKTLDDWIIVYGIMNNKIMIDNLHQY
jgi:hypothetical protein